MSLPAENSASIVKALDLSSTSYRDLYLNIERRYVSERLPNRCARIANALAVNALELCVRKQFGIVVDGLLKSRIFNFLGDVVGDPAIGTLEQRHAKSVQQARKSEKVGIHGLIRVLADSGAGVRILSRSGVPLCAAICAEDLADFELFDISNRISPGALWGLQIQIAMGDKILRGVGICEADVASVTVFGSGHGGSSVVTVSFRTPQRNGCVKDCAGLSINSLDLWMHFDGFPDDLDGDESRGSGYPEVCSLADFFGRWMPRTIAGTGGQRDYAYINYVGYHK